MAQQMSLMSLCEACYSTLTVESLWEQHTIHITPSNTQNTHSKTAQNTQMNKTMLRPWTIFGLTVVRPFPATLHDIYTSHCWVVRQQLLCTLNVNKQFIRMNDLRLVLPLVACNLHERTFGETLKYLTEFQISSNWPRFYSWVTTYGNKLWFLRKTQIVAILNFALSLQLFGS